MHSIDLYGISKSCLFIGSLVAVGLALPGAGFAQSACDAKCLAEKTQNPLANVRAVMTDNTMTFNTANGTAYGFQIQPVMSIPTDKGFNMVARAIIPVVGAPSGSDLPRLGGLTPASTPPTTYWGVSDIMAQLFFAPDTTSPIKSGFGPQVSFRTRTTSGVAGPGWGAGPAFVFFGSAGQLSYGAVLGHHWGQDGFNLSTVQPILLYNIESFPGVYVGYNNSITYDWSVHGGNRWQVPLGLTTGYTLALDGGYALDLSVGAYSLAAKPNGGGDWQFKFGVSLFLPS